jgi:hypothetical protein
MRCPTCSKANPAPGATARTSAARALATWISLKKSPAAAIGPTTRFADVTGDGVQDLLDSRGRATPTHFSAAARPRLIIPPPWRSTSASISPIRASHSSISTSTAGSTSCATTTRRLDLAATMGRPGISPRRARPAAARRPAPGRPRRAARGHGRRPPPGPRAHHADRRPHSRRPERRPRLFRRRDRNGRRPENVGDRSLGNRRREWRRRGRPRADRPPRGRPVGQSTRRHLRRGRRRHDWPELEADEVRDLERCRRQRHRRSCCASTPTARSPGATGRRSCSAPGSCRRRKMASATASP